MEIADALSRLSPVKTGEVKSMDVQIHEICQQRHDQENQGGYSGRSRTKRIEKTNIHRLAFRHQRSNSSHEAIVGIRR